MSNSNLDHPAYRKPSTAGRRGGRDARDGISRGDALGSNGEWCRVERCGSGEEDAPSRSARDAASMRREFSECCARRDERAVETLHMGNGAGWGSGIDSGVLVLTTVKERRQVRASRMRGRATMAARWQEEDALGVRRARPSKTGWRQAEEE
ncbi:hypothetical protein C8R44DRAFT_728641 [Mycena epipterygia]|nr:hypothetical protein C8R44DRAFT_728641 [Mycena epipterygia]